MSHQRRKNFIVEFFPNYGILYYSYTYYSIMNIHEYLNWLILNTSKVVGSYVAKLKGAMRIREKIGSLGIDELNGT